MDRCYLYTHYSYRYLTLFISNIALGIICVIEGIFYLTKSDEELNKPILLKRKNGFNLSFITKLATHNRQLTTDD